MVKAVKSQQHCATDVALCGTISMGTHIPVAHSGVTGICVLKTVGLSAVCDRKTVRTELILN